MEWKACGELYGMLFIFLFPLPRVRCSWGPNERKLGPPGSTGPLHQSRRMHRTSDMVQVQVTQQDRLLEAGALWAATDVERYLGPGINDAGLLRSTFVFVAVRQ